MFISVEL
jgi:hypothetical protein